MKCTHPSLEADSEVIVIACFQVKVKLLNEHNKTGCAVWSSPSAPCCLTPNIMVKPDQISDWEPGTPRNSLEDGGKNDDGECEKEMKRDE